MPEETSAQETKVAAQEAAENTALADFEWDESGSTDFFGIEGSAIEPVATEVTEVIKEVKKGEETPAETTPPVATKTTETEEEEEEDFFGIKETKDGIVETTEETAEEGEGVNYYTDTFAKMKEQGVFQNTELPENEEELTQEKFIELQDSEIESRVDEAFEGFFSELDSDAAAFLKHKKEGGSTEDFFKVYGQNTGTPTGDLDDETYQEKIASHYYKSVDGDDPEDIDDKIEWLKDSGKLEKYAEKFDNKIKENDKKSKEDLKKQTAASIKASDESKKAFSDSVQEALDNIEQVDNFKFTPKSKKSLFPFITKPTVKVGKNHYITGMQSKLQTALKTPEKMLILAQLLENDFDLSGIL
ncbi:MAG: hypothetical protein KAQ85_09090, partial [Thermodesulfovibrionia bacterium]|nr:hypothetical protein [Thermodesulfovibrionia bacterium]